MRSDSLMPSSPPLSAPPGEDRNEWGANDPRVKDGVAHGPKKAVTVLLVAIKRGSKHIRIREIIVLSGLNGSIDISNVSTSLLARHAKSILGVTLMRWTKREKEMRGRI